ncbi:MAG: IPT/TIG domain-containing protein [Deltaproteobacteria bacterium]|nr:IPT/TIG domain-containing protein [Deltaproteobacteria bacterium]
MALPWIDNWRFSLRFARALAIALAAMSCGEVDRAPGHTLAVDAVVGGETAAGDRFGELADVPPENKTPWMAPLPAIDKVWPDEGPTGGMQYVTITGQFFDAATQVRFGESPAVDFEVVDAQTIVARSPPRPPGLVDVAVHSKDRKDAVLADAYRFVATMSVDHVAPSQGPAAGGTAVVVAGSGFSAATQFVFADRAALQVVVIDDKTATMLTPPGLPGPRHLTAANGDGQAVLKKAFLYRAPPSLERVWPAVVPIEGDVPVTLHGSGLLAAGAKVTFTDGATSLAAPVVAGNASASQLTVKAPATYQPGLWSVQYQGQDGEALIKHAVAFVAADQGAQVLGVVPVALPVNVPQAVVVALSGPLTANNLAAAKVLIGDQPAKLLQSAPASPFVNTGGTLLVMPVAAAAGPLPQAVDVTVQFGPATLTKAKAFTWLPPVAKVVSVAPAQLLATGGTPLQVEVDHAQAHGGVVGLRIGALLAAQLKTGPSKGGAAQSLVAVAPPGSPGPADVVVSLADGSAAVLAGGAHFVATKTALHAVVPGSCAKSGGALVTVVGTGLDRVVALALDGSAVKEWKIQHNGAIRMRAPPHKPGAATLLATLDNGTQVSLSHALVYFDPISVENGSWGDAIDGALHVTVVKLGKIGPVPDATVIIGDDPKTALKGTTDGNGQITLSVDDLAGPLHVHASKLGWTAASAIALGVENITLRIREIPPASPGGGAANQPPAPPPGMVSVTVVDAEKYTVFPMGTCKGQPGKGGQCQPCSGTVACEGQTTCSALQQPLASPPLPSEATPATVPQYCLRACAAHSDCDAGYECRAVGESLLSAVFRCVPEIGARQARCEGSTYSVFGGAPTSPNQGVAGPDGKVTVAINPGDAAVVCRYGYLDAKTGEFVPLTMGVTRKLFAFPGQQVKNVLVHVNVPLDRTLRVRMEGVPMGADATGQRQLYAGLDLGAEGYIPLGMVQTYAQTDTLVFERQPAPSLWAGENGDLRYEVYGGLSQVYGSPPSSTSQATDIDPRGFGRYAVLPAGAPKLVLAGANLQGIAALDAAGDLKVAVGEGGTVLHWTGGTFTPQACPVKADLTSVWLDPKGTGDGWIGARDGQLLRKGPLGWQVWPQAAPRGIVAMAGRAGDDAWLVDSASQLMHWNGKVWQAASGPWPVPAPPPKNDAKPPPKQLRAIWHAHNGDLFLAGDAGTLLRLPAAKQTQSPTFETLNASTLWTIHGLWGDNSGPLWMVGDRGLVARHALGATKVYDTKTDQPLYGLRGLGGDAPVDVVGGRGTWLRIHASGEVVDLSDPDLRVDLKGWMPMFDGGRVAAGQPILRLGPYLEFPWLQIPAQGQPVTGEKGSYKILWTAKPGTDPTLNLVRITDAGYNTRWELFVRGTVTTAHLPNFAMLGAGNPLPGGTNYVRIWRIYAPGTEIDSFSTKNLSNSRWVSWAYHVRSTDEPPVYPQVPGAVPATELPKQGLPPWLPK